MTQYTLELNGMTCNSCEKIITRAIEKYSGRVKQIDAAKGYVEFEAQNNLFGQIKTDLAKKGYSEKGQPGTRGNPENIINYFKSIALSENQTEAEAKLVNYAIGSLLMLAIISTAFYFLFLQSITNGSRYIPLIALAVLTSVAATFSYIHMKLYREISCQNGMMVGMTIGMITGFLVGAIIGATSGMFMGSFIGLVAGIALGINIGKCCGIMGAMEGAMAGLMGGIMGAMTSVMLLNDNLILFLYILFIACSAILFGLSYMMYREQGEIITAEFKTGFKEFAIISIGFAVALMLIMVYAPKGPLTFV